MEARNLDFMHGTDWLQKLFGDFSLTGSAGNIEAAMTCGVDSAMAVFWGEDGTISRTQKERGIFELAIWTECHQDEAGIFYDVDSSRRFRCDCCTISWQYSERLHDQGLTFTAHMVLV